MSTPFRALDNATKTEAYVICWKGTNRVKPFVAPFLLLSGDLCFIPRLVAYYELLILPPVEIKEPQVVTTKRSPIETNVEKPEESPEQEETTPQEETPE